MPRPARPCGKVLLVSQGVVKGQKKGLRALDFWPKLLNLAFWGNLLPIGPKFVKK